MSVKQSGGRLLDDQDFRDKLNEFMGSTERDVKHLKNTVSEGLDRIENVVGDLAETVNEVKTVQDACPYKEENTGIVRLVNEVQTLTQEVTKRKTGTEYPAIGASLDAEAQAATIASSLSEALAPVLRRPDKKWYEHVPLIITIVLFLGALCGGFVWIIKGPGSVDPQLANDIKHMVHHYKKNNGIHKDAGHKKSP